EADPQAQLDGVGPVGQGLLAGVEDELDAHRVVLLANVLQSPVEGAHQAVGRRARAVILRLDLGGVARQGAEPGPAHRHTAAQALTAPVFDLLAEPDQRRAVVALVAQQLGALFGDQQLRAAMANAPAHQFTDLLVCDPGLHGPSSEAGDGRDGSTKQNARRGTGVSAGGAATYWP